MLAGCGSSSRSQTDNTESSSQNEASSSSASETADATEDSENTETPTPAENDDSSETAVADDTESTGKTLVVYYSATGTIEGVAQTIADATGGDYSKSSRWNLIQMMIWTGQMMIVVYPENMMMKV